MVADESTQDSQEAPQPASPARREPVASIERRHAEDALARLESQCSLTRAQRTAIVTLATRISTSLGPAAIETVRIARTNAESNANE